MKRSVEPILEEKGYYYAFMGPDFNNKATIRINSDEMISIILDIELLDDFLEQLVNLVKSLPKLPQKLEEKLPF
jgi:hypothetical protein